jgi:hypothetical protein
MGARTETAGSLIVDLRADAANFVASMGKAEKAMGGVGKSARGAEDAVTKFAVKGLGELIPGGQMAERALERLIDKANALGGAWKLAGQVGVIIAGVTAVAAAVQKLDEEIRNFLALGETTTQTINRINDELKEEKANLDALAKSRATLNSLDKEIAALRGDDLEVLRLETKEREAQILATTQGVAREQAMGKLQELNALKRAEAEQKWADQVLKDIQEEMKARQAALETETRMLTDQLTTQAKLRQDFVARIGTGGLAGPDITTAFREVSDFNEQYQESLRQISFLEREGVVSSNDAMQARITKEQQALAAVDSLKAKYGELPAALDVIEQSTRRVLVGDKTLWEDADTWVATHIDTLGQLQARQTALAAKLTELAQISDVNNDAVRTLTASYQQLAVSVYDSVRAFQAWQSTVGG